MPNIQKLVDDLKAIGLVKEASKLMAEHNKEETNKREQKEFKEQMALPCRTTEDINRANNLLDVGGEDLPEDVKVKLNILSQPQKPNIYVETRNWFGAEYKKEYKKKVDSVKTTTWLEKLEHIC